MTADDDSPATGPRDARPEVKRARRENATLETGPAQPVDAGSNPDGRPTRQSAVKARQHLQERTSLDGDDDDCHAPNSAPQKGYTELVRETEQLLKDLPSRPSQDNFEEESAWRFHNPPFPQSSKQQLTALCDNAVPSMPAPIPPEQLQPLPSAPPLPQPPSTGQCRWSYDDESRVLLADFTRCGEAEQIVVTPEDEAFLFQMMERDDITVISDGLAESIDPRIWTRKYIEGCIGDGYHHKFRAFEAAQENGVDQQPNGQPKENEGMYSMKVADYFRYLDQRQSIKEAKSDGAQGKAERFTFVDSYGNKQSVNVDEVCLVSSLLALLSSSFDVADLPSCPSVPCRTSFCSICSTWMYQSCCPEHSKTFSATSTFRASFPEARTA